MIHTQEKTNIVNGRIDLVFPEQDTVIELEVEGQVPLTPQLVALCKQLADSAYTDIRTSSILQTEGN
jgi:hypothetical protein